MLPVVLEAFAAFSDGGHVADGDPPEAIAGLFELGEPLGTIAEHAKMVRAVGEVAEGLQRLPDGHVDEEEGVVAVGDVRGVAGSRLQAPDEPEGTVGDGVDGIEESDEVGHARIVHREEHASQIDLGEVVRHGLAMGSGMLEVMDG